MTKRMGFHSRCWRERIFICAVLVIASTMLISPTVSLAEAVAVERPDTDIEWNEMGCTEFFSTEKPIHPQHTWKQAIEIYKTVVQDSNLDPLNNGFSVGFEAKQAEDQFKGKGRGIYATHSIKKGDLIWSTKRTATFDNHDDYQLFLSKLETSFVCEAIQCAYVKDMSDNDEEEDLKINIDLDEACFCNGNIYDDGLVANVGCDEDAAKNFEGGCTANSFALDDIIAGNEFICDYEEYYYP